MKSKTSLLVFMVCWFIPKPVFNQTDTLTHNAMVNKVTIPEKYRDRNKAWYVDAIVSFPNPKVGTEIRYGLGVSNEFKLKRQHSLGAGLNILMVDEAPVFSYSHPVMSFEVKLEYRYYHNLNNRMSWGLTANNFYADYFLVSPYVSFGYSSYNEGFRFDFDSGSWIKEVKNTLRVDPCLRLGYGIQRPIVKRIGFNLNGGFQLQRTLYLYSPWSLVYFQFCIQYTF